MNNLEKYYCNKLKSNIWLLGYFGGGSISYKDYSIVAVQFSHETRLPLNSIYMDKIFSSSRFEKFKYIYSEEKDQIPLNNAIVKEDLFKFLKF